MIAVVPDNPTEKDDLMTQPAYLEMVKGLD
jgi:hypothetical protein